MFTARKIAILLFAPVNFLIFHFFLSQPNNIVFWGILALILSLAVLLLLTVKKISLLDGLFFYLSNLITFFSTLLFLLIVEGPILKYLIVVLFTLLVFLFFQSLFYYLYQTEKYQTFSLAYFYEIYGLITVFFLSSSLLALFIFLSWSFWLILLSIVAVVTFFVAINLWINKIDLKKYFYVLLIFVVLFAEINYILIWLPLNYFLKGFLATIFYFLFVNFFNQRIKNKIGRKIYIYYLLTSLAIILLVLLTARWG